MEKKSGNEMTDDRAGVQIGGGGGQEACEGRETGRVGGRVWFLLWGGSERLGGCEGEMTGQEVKRQEVMAGLESGLRT